MRKWMLVLSVLFLTGIVAGCGTGSEVGPFSVHAPLTLQDGKLILTPEKGFAFRQSDGMLVDTHGVEYKKQQTTALQNRKNK